MRMLMSNHDLSNFVLQWWVAGLFQRHRVSTKIELTYLGASTRDTGLMGLDPESREMENVYELIPDENSTVRRNYLRTWCAQEEFWRSPNVWKVSFWWCTVPYWRGTLTILWSDEREGSRSTRWRQRSRRPEHRRLEERVPTMVTTRANDETDGLTTQSPFCHLPLTMLTTKSTKKLWWLDLKDTQIKLIRRHQLMAQTCLRHKPYQNNQNSVQVTSETTLLITI